MSIRVDGLGKQYRIGRKKQPYRRFTEVVTDGFMAPFRRWLKRAQPAGADELIWALRGVSFEVASGEVLGIVGRNGAGKSTLLKVLSRVTPPTEGRVEMKGHVGAILEVGTGFHPELTGRENIYLNASILGMRRREIDRKLDAIVAFAEIEPFLDTPIKHYSSGMHVRLAFAVAAHLDPDILVVDEALAVGDAAFQKKCLGHMRQAARTRARTVLFVSHNLGAIKVLCDRALWLDKGEVRLAGDPEQVVAAYLEDGVPAPDGTVPEDAPRLEGITREAVLKRVSLRDTVGRPLRQVFLGQPFQVVLLFDVKASLPDAVVELGISTVDGLRVMTLNSIDGGQPCLSLGPGRHEIAVDIHETLLPHEYALDVGLHHLSGGTALTIEWIEQALRFSALGTAATGPDRYPWNAVRGFVRPKAIWRAPVAAS